MSTLSERYTLHGNTVAATIRQIVSSLGTSLLVTIAALFSTTAQNKEISKISALQIGYS